MSDFSYRQAVPADWPAIESLLRAHDLPLDGAREHLGTFVVAVRGQTVVGCAGAEPHGGVALLRSVAVAGDLAGHGIGARLVALLIEQAMRRNIGAVYLLTTTARHYFERFGFVAARRRDAPPALMQSAEMRGACPDSADFMVLALAPSVNHDPTGYPVAVLGAGPVGLAAAARLHERAIPFFVLEAAPHVGAHLADYGHVRLFSPWRFNIDPAVATLLEATGWHAPDPDALPLAGEVVQRVLEPFARLPQIAPHLHLGTRVLAVSREGFDKVKTAGRERAPFVIRALRGGEAVELKARAVIDATGTWGQPNPVGANGLPALGEAEAADRIAYGIPDVLGAQRARYAGRHTLVVGAGHSAANALLFLAELAGQAPGTRLAWAVRSPQLARVFGGGANDALAARGALGTALRQLRDSGGLVFHEGLHITRIERSDGALSVLGTGPDGRARRLDGIDEIICVTGQRPDRSLTGELRVALDPWLESNEALGPLIDPNLHSCGTVRPHGHRELAHPEPGLYTVGVKSYGRAPTFLMATGFEQVRSVVAAIAGDFDAADRVELELPQTGVCSVGALESTVAAGASCCDAPPRTEAIAASCCGGPPKTDSAACCVRDETARTAGQGGCGCDDAKAGPKADMPMTEPPRAETSDAEAPMARPTCC